MADKRRPLYKSPTGVIQPRDPLPKSKPNPEPPARPATAFFTSVPPENMDAFATQAPTAYRELLDQYQAERGLDQSQESVVDLMANYLAAKGSMKDLDIFIDKLNLGREKTTMRQKVMDRIVQRMWGAQQSNGASDPQIWGAMGRGKQ